MTGRGARGSRTRAIAALAAVLGCQAALADDLALDPSRSEVGGLPVLAYDSDLGLVVGGIVSLARFAPGRAPYAWRLQAIASTSFKQRASGLALPLHDDSLALDVPGLLSGAIRLTAELAFRRHDDAGWFGPGGDSSAALPAGAPATYHAYTRLFPGASLNVRARLYEPADRSPGRLELLLGAELTYSDVRVTPGSLLDEQLALARAGGPGDAAVLSQVLRGIAPHTLARLRIGLLYDTRDHELAPTRGVFLEASTRVAPAPRQLRHVGLFASAAGFVELGSRRVVAAGRVLGDALIGAPPFYALAQAGVSSPLFAPGGGGSVRGVALQRFSGKLKLVANAELRVELARFTARAQRLRLGAVAFADVGRALADWRPTTLGGRSTDGPWTRAAVGLGGGVRLIWGEAFAIRADLAYSPSERTRGVYVGIGQVF